MKCLYYLSFDLGITYCTIDIYTFLYKYVSMHILMGVHFDGKRTRYVKVIRAFTF